ncbi:DNA topology modulation protein FlaR [Filobacillus milosensis]|uniref:DNA topology modulation protein FlaR n=1 Tax=Filobacillus milosensis TaxID=94137 RepID=A0A4Y8III7_9BACI|nr:AAA family ATPase [Filobacillus milosensis]TFB19492.1 DNA topology modulation protein FlaR [Filobacillus milosensis]
MINIKRIHIIGSVGSGKTTLSRKLSKEYVIPHYELDNVVWKREKSGDIRRTIEERDQQLTEIVTQEKWIIEGVHDKWVLPSFKHADIIIFLDTPKRIRTARIIKRFVKQLLKVEKANYKPSWNMFLQMFKWNNQFEEKNKFEILQTLKPFEDKLIILNNEVDLEEVINSNYKK